MHRSKWALQPTGHYTLLGLIGCFMVLLKDTLTNLFVYLLVVNPFLCCPVFLNFLWDYPSSQRLAFPLPQAERMSVTLALNTSIPSHSDQHSNKQNILSALL